MGKRMAAVAALFCIAVGLVVFTAMDYLRSNPPTINFTAGHKPGQAVDLTLQTLGTIGSGAHPTWVSYLTLAPDGKWVHTTMWDVPAHTMVHVKILQYDTGSPLRNQILGHVLGTVGGTMTLNGKTISLVNSNSGNGVAHTFTIPTLGIDVPLYGVPSSSNNICSAGPCSTNDPHNIVTFSFMSPGVGQYPWQCFIPCGLGYLYGNGGPMQSIGYMDGFMKVVS